MTTRMLIVMRHAKSSWKAVGASDFDRPLNSRGLRDAPLMGEYLKSYCPHPPQKVLCSPALRTRETLKGILKGSGWDPEIQYEDGYYLGEPDDWYLGIESCSDDMHSLMLIGHNPGIEELIYELSHEGHEISTCNVALFELELEEWAKIQATPRSRLVSVLRPKALWAE